MSCHIPYISLLVKMTFYGEVNCHCDSRSIGFMDRLELISIKPHLSLFLCSSFSALIFFKIFVQIFALSTSYLQAQISSIAFLLYLLLFISFILVIIHECGDSGNVSISSMPEKKQALWWVQPRIIYQTLRLSVKSLELRPLSSSKLVSALKMTGAITPSLLALILELWILFPFSIMRD